MKRSTMTAAVLAAALSAPASAQALPYEASVLQDSPLTYLRFEETSGLIAQDASPNDRDGSYESATLGTAGPFTDAGRAVALAQGATVRANVETATGSAELWVNPVRLRRFEQAGYLSHGNPDGDGWALGIGSKRKLTFVSRGKSVSLRRTVPANAWTMLAATWSGTRVKLFVNGALAKDVELGAGAPAALDPGVQVGGTAAGAFKGHFGGRIDEVALFDKALTAEQLAGHFAAAKVPINTTPPAVTGAAAVGQTLTVVPGTWTAATLAPSYQWQSCDRMGEDCDDIAGATGSTYLVVAADAGATLQVVETAANASGATSAVSDITSVVTGGTDPDGGGSSGGDPGTGGDPGAGGDPGTGGDPATGTGSSPGDGTGTDAAPSSTDAPQSGGAAGQGSPGTIAVLGESSSQQCIRLARSARKPRLGRVGKLRFVLPRHGCLAKGAPLGLKVARARHQRLQAVRYRLDGKKIAGARPARTAKLNVAKVRPGRHRLNIRITTRDGVTRVFKIRFRTLQG